MDVAASRVLTFTSEGTIYRDEQDDFGRSVRPEPVEGRAGWIKAPRQHGISLVTAGRCQENLGCDRIAAVIAKATDALGYWIALSQTPGLGAARFRLLESHFDGDLESAWKARRGELRAAGIGGGVVKAIVEGREKVSPDGELEKLYRSGVAALTWHDEEYPRRLKEIADAPPVLYCRGTLHPNDETSVAVVGTRRPTDYGYRITAELCAELAARGVVVVSGLALGIDARAHQATVDAGGRTIVALGNGLDMVYPRENQRLAERIVNEGGALVSEFPLGARPEASNFPRRNRIISGMTLGTLITEASETSGTRWTVYHALEQNREIFCVPGSVYSDASKLTNRLIREGAKLVCEVNDILVEIGLDAAVRQMAMAIDDSDGQQSRIAQDDAPDDPDEADLLRHITHEATHIDDLARLAGRPITEVSGLLTMLEIKGLVVQAGMMHYRLP
ncbi:MAG: DNA-protecting protein DprA [Chloroflexi bacterium]|nr:DNA-protecting protein DprA [Chloroflexota bacterium]